MRLFSIKNIIKNNNELRMPTDAARIAPTRDWVRILWVSFILIIALVLWSMYILQEVKNDDIFKNTKKITSGVTVINQKSLDEVSRYFEMKKQKTEALLITPVMIQDPSL